MSQVLDDLYAQCNPRLDVPAGDSRYVDWHATVGADDVKVLLPRNLRRSHEPEFRLLTGHRGSGKSSELNRVVDTLEIGGDFICEVKAGDDSSGLSLDDVQPSELLVSIAHHLVDHLEQAGIDIQEPKRGLLDMFRSALGDGQVDFDLKVLSLSVDLRNQAREYFGSRVPTLLSILNDQLIIPAQQQLGRRIVVVVDELDRLEATRSGSSVPSNQEALFVHGENILRGLACSAVYTVPVELAYSLANSRLSDLYDEVLEVGLIPVLDRSGQPDPQAVGFMTDVLDRRVASAGLATVDVIKDPAIREELIISSGGHVRALFRFIRTLIDTVDALPLDGAIKSVLDKAADDQVMQVLDPHRQVLTQLCTPGSEGQAPTAEGDQVAWYELLKNNRVLVYHGADKRRWYAPNPLLRRVPGLLP